MDRDAEPDPGRQRLQERAGHVRSGCARPAHSTDHPTRPSAAASSCAAIVPGGVSLPSSATAPASAAWLVSTGIGRAGDQHDPHAGRGALLLQPPADLDPAQSRHPHVQQRDVGLVLDDPRERRGAVGRLPDDLERGVLGDEPRDAGPIALVVIRDEDPFGRRPGRTVQHRTIMPIGRAA